MLVTIRVHDCHVVVDGKDSGPHCVAIGYLPSGQELTRGTILAGHSPSVQSEAVGDVSAWIHKNRPGWDIETLPGELVCPTLNTTGKR